MTGIYILRDFALKKSDLYLENLISVSLSDVEPVQNLLGLQAATNLMKMIKSKIS